MDTFVKGSEWGLKARAADLLLVARLMVENPDYG
jgi:hypothetical protein